MSDDKREIISGLGLDVRILARDVDQPGRTDVVLQTIDRMQAELRRLRGQLESRSEAADVAYAKLHPDPYASWVNGEPPGGAA
jgi:hypothetical protein